MEQPVKLELRPARPAPAPQARPKQTAKTILAEAAEIFWRFVERNPLASVTVGLPVFLSVFYYGLLASNIYVSEAHFIVRSKSTSSALGGISETSALQPLSSMSASNDDTQQVNDYLSSRDAMDRLIQDASLLELLSRREADFLSRFPRLFWSRDTREALFERFGDFVHPSIDSSTGISTLYVYAFRPEDARQIAMASLAYGEELVNRLNERARNDNIAFAREMLAKAEEKVKVAQRLLTEFRNREAIFDPKRQGGAIIELISKLNGDIAQLKAERGEVNANSPGSPKIASINARINAFEHQIEEQRADITGGDKSLASKLGEYEKLAVEYDLAAKLFSSSLMSLEGAIRDAQQQRLYLERVVEPNLSDYPLYPRRIRSILTILGFSLCVYWILKVLGTIVWEHDPS